VLQRTHEMFKDVFYTPAPVSSDSDRVRCALETARALESQGDTREAARWLRRAADEADKEGNDARVLVLARAAADLMSAPGPAPPHALASPPSWNPPDSPRMTQPTDLDEPTIRTPAPSELWNSSGDSSAPILTPAPRSAPASQSSFVSRLSPSAHEQQLVGRTRLGAIRVALKRSIRDAKVFTVERLEPGQPLPAGATEAMLVLAGDTAGSRDSEADTTVWEDAKAKR
jgi:hypothetical protein